MGIYLDHGATSFPKPDCVYEAVNEFMRHNGASPGRGNYAKAMQSEQIVYETRKALCELLGIKKPGSIIFTSNITEAINTVVKGFLSPGDAVLTSNIEHNSVWRPLKKLEKNGTIKLHQFHCAPDGSVDLDEIAKLLDSTIKLLAITHGSNVLGNVMPIQEIITLAHERNVAVLLDSAQTAGVYPIDVGKLDIDFFAFTGHKGLLGPTGTGGFYLKQGMQLDTLKEGGTGSMSRSPFQPELPPDRFEVGTMNMFGIAGLHASVQFLCKTGVEQIRKHELGLVDCLLQGLRQIPDITVYGPTGHLERLGLVSFNIGKHDPYKIAKQLDDDFSIMVRAGLHCAPQTHQLLGTEDRGAVRVSVGYANTSEEIQTLLSALTTITKGK